MATMFTLKSPTSSKRIQILGEIGSGLPDGSATTFGNVDGTPAEREEAYAILSGDLNALGAITQTMSGKKALMTVADMIYWLNRVQYIPQGNAESVQSVSQISVATGIVPTVYRGSAISIQSVSNVSTAVGSLVESA